MDIPVRFKLFARTISVVWTEGPFVERPECSAFSSFRLDQIQMNPNPVVGGPNDDRSKQSFCHELMHFILYHTGAAFRGDDPTLMHRDEDFVDLCGNMLHQVLETAEYGEHTIA